MDWDAFGAIRKYVACGYFQFCVAYDAATERELVIMDAFGGVYRLVKQVIVKVQLYVKLIIGYLYSTAVYPQIRNL